MINAARAELLHLKGMVPESPPGTPRLDALVCRPRVGVGAVLLSSSRPGCVLVGERLGSHGAGRWALPGGHLEFLASCEGCASAEVEEEVGLALAPARFHFITATNDPMPAEDLHYVTLFVTARVAEEELAAVTNREPDKCGGWAWVRWEELRAGARPMFGPLRRFIDAGGPERAGALAFA